MPHTENLYLSRDSCEDLSRDTSATVLFSLADLTPDSTDNILTRLWARGNIGRTI